MPAGTPTQGDSYWLSQSAVFKTRVQSALISICTSINSEATTGVTGNMPNSVHSARKNFVVTILNPANFTNWLGQFVAVCSCDATVIADATSAAANYAPITTAAQGDTASAEAGNIPDIAIVNAISAAFNTFVPGI